jgi:hypothetical protein
MGRCVAHSKNEIKPWLKQQYCLPGEPSGEFIFPMEDVLEVYTRPYDPYRPHLCLDEASVQLVGETCMPLPTRPGQPARYDYEYERHRVSAVFMFNEPPRSWWEVVVADQCIAIDWAHVGKHLVDVHYPDAEQIVLVMDNLNTHTPGSLYEAFEPVSGSPHSQQGSLVAETTAWTHERNIEHSTRDWRSTTSEARITLKRLYPSLLP